MGKIGALLLSAAALATAVAAAPGAGDAATVSRASAGRVVSVHQALRMCARVPGTYRLTVQGYFVERPQTQAGLQGALADRPADLPPDAQLSTNPWPPPGTLYVAVDLDIVLRSNGVVPERRLVRVRGILRCEVPILDATKYPVTVKKKR